MSEAVEVPGAEAECQVIMPGQVVGYVRDTLPSAAAWSVERHLPECASCRLVLASCLDQEQLERDRAELFTRLALVEGGWAATCAITRCGVPAHIWRLLSVTPSLRRSWLTGVVLVLGAAIGAAWLAAPAGPGMAGPAGSWWAAPAGLLPFLILAPLLPLAGVGAAFHPRLDPAAVLAVAAPVSRVWLFCVRSVAVIGATLIPAVLAAFALPGNAWLPLLVVAPALAVSAAALALATLVRPLLAVAAAGAGWVAVVLAAGVRAGSPSAAYGGLAQVLCLAVIVAAGLLLAARRRALELGRSW